MFGTTFFADNSISGSGSITPIALISNTQKGSINLTDVTTNAIDTTGATLLVVSSTSAGNSVITDSKGNSWLPLTQRLSTSGGSVQLFYVTNPIVGTGHTFTNTQTAPSLSVLAFSGVITSSPFDVQNGAGAAASSSLATGSITPNQANEVIITGLAVDGSTTSDYIVNSGFIASTYIPVVAGQCFGSGIAYKIQTTATAVNPTWSGTSGGLAVAIASFKHN